jgi:tetratricopeptide (TPR) repeat protein
MYWRVSLALTLFLVAITPLSSFTPLGEADAHAEDEKRRVLRAQDIGQDDVSDEYARMAAQKRLESIRRLKELLSKGVQGETKAEMMLRLADLYFQQGRYLYLNEMAEFDKAYDICFNTDGCELQRLQPDNAVSRTWQEKSIKLYEGILRNFTRYSRADQATFYLGAAHQDLGRLDEAIGSFKRLVKLYPQSSFVPDAFVLIGEYYFDKNNAYQALRAYQKATQYKDSEKYPFAMYKLGWCFYNVGDYGKAIDTMKAVVSYSMGQGAGGRLQLQEEALKDLVRFFADAGEMAEAYEYFNKLGKKELIQAMLKRLANMYFEQGKFDECVETYRRLILENPQSSDCPDYQHEIIQAYRKVGRREKTLEEIDRLRRDYGKNSAWARANASNQEAVVDATKRVEENLRRVAVEYHNKARQLDKGGRKDAPGVFELARRAYSTYLEEFPAGEHVYEVRYAYGELLYKVKRFDEAFDQYMAVVEIDPKGKHSRFCAGSAIYSASAMVKKAGGGKPVRMAAGAKKEPQPLTDWEKRLVDSSARFAELYPEDKKVIGFIYESAYLLYYKFRFAEAADQFKRVIKMDPRSKQAETAANLILDSFVVNEDWSNLKKNSKFYYDQESLGGSRFKKEVYEIYENSSFKVIEVDFTADEDKGKAADRFVAFYKEFPISKQSAKALNNASVYYTQVDRIVDSMKTRHILVEDPKFGPKTKYYYDQISNLGFNYETVADFAKAAFYYEKLFALYPEERKKKAKEDADSVEQMDSQAGDAIYSAAVFRKALGEWKKAVENYGKFIAAFPKDERVTDVRMTIARTYEDEKDWAKAANVYYSFYTKDGKDTGQEYTYFARLHYAYALEHQRQTAKATQVYKDTVALYKKYMQAGGEKGAHTEFVAEMMFELAERQFEEYLALKLEGAPKGSSKKREDKAITESLKVKSKSMLETEAVYKEIIQTGAGAWGLAALMKLGAAYENMGDTLKNGKIPFYLTKDQREMYNMAIEDQVYSQQEKAVAAYKLALEKSYELTLYNENTALATRRLGELRPDDFPGLYETLLDPNYASIETRSFDFETEF